jgi:hypothetical protein
MRTTRPPRVPATPDAHRLEGRRLFATYDIVGVQPASLDQPQINVLFRDAPTGDPLGGTGPDDGLLIKAFLDTGASGVLLSLESAEGLPLDAGTYNGQTVPFTDADAVKDAGEAGLSAWKVYIDANNDGKW